MNDFKALFLQLTDIVNARPAEIMDEVGGLRRIPPLEVFGVEANGVKSGQRLLDLDLKAAVGEQKGTGMIQQYFHSAE